MRKPVHGEGRRQPALHDNQSKTPVMVAAETTTAKRRAWLDDALAETDALWHERHVLPLLRALGALPR